MATVTNNQNTYYTNDSKHRLTTHKIGTKYKSELNYLRYNILLSKNRDVIESTGLMSKRQLDAIDKRVPYLKSLASNGMFYQSRISKADTNITQPQLNMLHDGFYDSPLKASQDSSNYSKQLRTIINILYSMLPVNVTEHLYPYLITVSDRNCSSGELRDKLRGKKSKHSSKLLDNFRVSMKVILEFIRRHFPTLGGVSKTEITINYAKLLDEIEQQLFHQHQHLLIFTFTPIDTHKTFKGNHVNNFIYEEIEKVLGSKNVSRLALDIKQVSPDSGNLGNAIDEVSKYTAKPDLYSYFDDISERDVENNNFDKFQLLTFAEIRGATYNLQMKNKFGIFDSIDKFVNRLGRFKSAINAASANNPLFNIFGRRTFGKVLTQEGLLIYTNGKQEKHHWKLIHFNAMNDKNFLYSNRSLISNVLVGSKQLDWLNNTITNLDAKNLGIKDKYFDYAINYLNNIPFLNSVDDLIKWIESVADKKMKDAKSYLYKSKTFNCEEFHSYQMYRNDANDMYRLIDCIKKYSDEHGVLKLGLHTNPDFKIKVYQWVQSYKGSLNYLGCDIDKGWRFFGAIHNGQKYVVDEFTSDEQAFYRKAMDFADKSLGYIEIAPRPLEMVCLDRVGCFIKYDVNHLDSSIDLNDTGELIDENHYDMLTAPSFDTYNYSKDGTGFDINLFAKINDAKTVQFDLKRAISSFIKSNSSKFTSNCKAKKMANAY